MEEEKRISRDLGQRIIELRRARKLTQEQVAERLQVDARELRRIEGGGNTTVHTLVRLARAFGIPVAALFEAPKVRAARKPGRPTKASTTTRKPPGRPSTRAASRPNPSAK